MPKAEKHYANRIGWLRAPLLGANEGIVSTNNLLRHQLIHSIHQLS